MYNIPKFRRPKIFRRSLITENYENFIPNFLENFQYKANFETIEGVGTEKILRLSRKNIGFKLL